VDERCFAYFDDSSLSISSLGVANDWLVHCARQQTKWRPHCVARNPESRPPLGREVLGAGRLMATPLHNRQPPLAFCLATTAPNATPSLQGFPQPRTRLLRVRHQLCGPRPPTSFPLLVSPAAGLRIHCGKAFAALPTSTGTSFELDSATQLSWHCCHLLLRWNCRHCPCHRLCVDNRVGASFKEHHPSSWLKDSRSLGPRRLYVQLPCAEHWFRSA